MNTLQYSHTLRIALELYCRMCDALVDPMAVGFIRASQHSSLVSQTAIKLTGAGVFALVLMLVRSTRRMLTKGIPPVAGV